MMPPADHAVSREADECDMAMASEARARLSLGISGGSSLYAWAVRGVEEQIRNSESILDLGCGVGMLGSFLWEHFGQKPHGLDLVRHEGFRQEHYASFALRNLESLVPERRPYDLVFAIGLIEYFPNPRAFIHSLSGLLKPNAKVVLTAPNPASLLNIVSLFRRGEFSAFRESSNPASITPVLSIDAGRMFHEAGFQDVQTDYSASGRVPFLRSTYYQELCPALRGRLWSDNFRLIASMGAR